MKIKKFSLTIILSIVFILSLITMLPSVTQAARLDAPEYQPLPTRPTSVPTALPLPTRPTDATPSPTPTVTPTQEPTPSATAPSPAPDGKGGIIQLLVRPVSDEQPTARQWQTLWTIVQNQDTRGEWQDVQAWQGTLDEVKAAQGIKSWWVAPENLGEGPFRWQVYERRAGSLLATSESFYLPAEVDQIVQVRMSISFEAPAIVETSTRTGGAASVPPVAPPIAPPDAEHGGSWQGNVYEAHTAGTWSIQATYKGQTARVVLAVGTGALSYILVSPQEANVTAGQPFAFTAQAFDAQNNSLGDVTANTNFTIVEHGHEGRWSANRFVGQIAGAWTVRASYDGKVADATLNVEPGQLSNIAISPSEATLAAGDEQPFTIEAFDVYGNSLGDVTDAVDFMVIEWGHNGAWAGNAYTAHTAGDWSVRGAYQGRTAGASLTVTAADASYIVIQPDTTRATAGEMRAFTTQAFDAQGNLLGDVTSETDFEIVEAKHGGAWRDNHYTAHSAGDWTVRGSYDGLTAEVALNVKPATMSYILVAPDRVTVTAGEEQAYAAQAFDAYDNPLGDVTAGTRFAIVDGGHNGRWARETYTAHTAGTWTVRGFYGNLIDDARLLVEPGEFSYIVVTPGNENVAAGEQLTFTAEAFDAYGNSLGDVTDETEFDVVQGD